MSVVLGGMKKITKSPKRRQPYKACTTKLWARSTIFPNAKVIARYISLNEMQVPRKPLFDVDSPPKKINKYKKFNWHFVGRGIYEVFDINNEVIHFFI